MKPGAGPFEAALERMGAYFLGQSPLHSAAAGIARRLDDLGVDYAIAGALCLAAHGVVRATEGIDVLVSHEGLQAFRQAWLGRGYVALRPGGRALRDTVNGVKVDFLVAGDYPGDGKPKPVVFPDPGTASVAVEGYTVLGLPRFVELKLASGMTAPHRLQDLADVQRLIAAARLPRDFAAALHPYVHAKFDELWLSAQHVDEDD